MKMDLGNAVPCWIAVLVFSLTAECIIAENITYRSINQEPCEIALSSYSRPPNISKYIIVDKYGKGQYTTVQAAIDSVPEKNVQWVYIQINAAVYFEKVTIPYTKPYIILQGAGKMSTVISWNARASSYGTADSATFSVNANNFIARGIGFKNGASPPLPGASGGQAVAVLLAGDMMAFYECGFYGAQDTLFDYEGRHYFEGCYIEGSIDFIFGHGQSTYKGCELYVKAQEGYVSGSITAQNREEVKEESGFVFLQCNITGSGDVYLGRAWGKYSTVIFIHTYMSGVVDPQGWSDFDIPSRRRTTYYGEYKCFGPGANSTKRVPWAHQLNDEEVKPFLQLSYIDGETWLGET